MPAVTRVGISLAIKVRNSARQIRVSKHNAQHPRILTYQVNDVPGGQRPMPIGCAACVQSSLIIPDPGIPRVAVGATLENPAGSLERSRLRSDQGLGNPETRIPMGKESGRRQVPPIVVN